MRDYMALLGGRVEAIASGGQIEQFMNQMHRRRIPYRKPRRTEDGALLFTLPSRDFKRLRQPAFKTGTRVHIVKKRGLFMLLRPFKKRWGIVVGFVLFMGLVLYSSCFIWHVEVQGCVNTSSTQIIADLQELGLGVGIRRTVDVGPIENRYLTGNQKLSWISVNIRGTTAYVEVKEKGVHPQVVDLTVPTNIYAARDGVILSVRDYGGTRQVQVGQAVTAGQLLVSGDWTDKYGVRHLNHCIATVMAQTQHQTAVTVPLEEDLRQKTGKIRKKFAVSFGNFKFPLYFTQKISYNEYDTVYKEYPLRIAAFAFPLRFCVTAYQEVQTVPITRTAEQAKAVAFSQLAFYQEDTLSGLTVQKRVVQENLTPKELQLQAVFYCEEEIGVAMPIEE